MSKLIDELCLVMFLFLAFDTMISTQMKSDRYLLTFFPFGFLGHGADVKCVDWHPQKGLIVSGSKDNQQPVKLWDPKTGQSLATL